MTEFEHVRHKPPIELDRPREIVVACPQLQSNVNLSRLVRVAGCCGVTRIVVGGNASIDRNIARDGADAVEIEKRRSLGPALERLKSEGYILVGLEQTTNSKVIWDYAFPRKIVLVLGHERHGITDDILKLLDAVVEIPVYGMPFSFNVASAATMALYEYCRQYPRG